MATAQSAIGGQAKMHADENKFILESSLRFDLLMVFLSFWFLCGLFLDGWAHNHGRVDDSFFTPWHAVFYSGFTIVAIAHLWILYRNVNRGIAFSQALPDGYNLSLLGVAIFALGGLGDMVWHTVFGIEENIEALLSPTHLMLGLGMFLIFSAPLRSFVARATKGGGWLKWLPAILSMSFTISVMTFFLQYLFPLSFPVGFQIDEEISPQNQIMKMNADGTLQTRLVNLMDADAFHPAWSADGEQIAFVSNQDGNYEIYTMNADGTNIQRLTENEFVDQEPTWSPDGSQITFPRIVMVCKLFTR